MFTQLYRSPSAIARHLNAPYAEERIRYLVHCTNHGYSQATLLLKARELLWVARKLSAYGSLQLTIEQIEAAAQDWHEREQAWGQPLPIQWTRVRFIEAARAWLRFLGRLRPSAGPPPFAEHLEDYATWMERERGLAASTIRQRRQGIAQFLCWYGARQSCFEAIGLGDIDAYLSEGLAAGWRRRSVRNVAAVLRAFCRFGASRGGCSAGLADAIRGPRVYTDEGLSLGPDWSDVQRLLATLETDHLADIRDRAVLMLFAIYGLRATEVALLRLADFDGDRDLLHVRRVKGRGSQIYPLLPAVGNAVACYLKAGRPPSTRSNVFLTLVPPFRPLSRAAMYSLTCKRLGTSAAVPGYSRSSVVPWERSTWPRWIGVP